MSDQPPQILHATLAGPLALESLRIPALKVLTVFERSLYLAADTHDTGLICICRQTLSPGPFNMLCAPWPDRLPDKNSPARLTEGRLHIGQTWMLNLEHVQTWKPEPFSCLAPEQLKARLCNAIRIFNTHPLPAAGLGCLLPLFAGSGSHDKKAIAQQMTEMLPLASAAGSGTALVQEALPGICQLWEWLTGQTSSPARGVAALIGLGPGLTPSGDDVLGGVLIALQATGQEIQFKQLCRAVRDRETATNRISRAHLHAAMHGMGAHALHQWLTALAGEGDTQNMQHTAVQLDAVGHSSGWDAALGVFLVVQARVCMA